MKKQKIFLVLMISVICLGCSTTPPSYLKGLDYMGNYLETEKKDIPYITDVLINTIIEIENKRYDEYLEQAKMKIYQINKGEDAIKEYEELILAIQHEREKLETFYNRVREYIKSFELNKVNKAENILKALKKYNGTGTLELQDVEDLGNSIVDVLKIVSEEDSEGSGSFLDVIQELEKNLHEKRDNSNNRGS